MPKYGLQILDENREEVDCFMENFENQKVLLDWWIENAGAEGNENWYFCIFWRFSFNMNSIEKIVARGSRKLNLFEN